VQKNVASPNDAGAVVSLSKWLGQVGVTACTTWRWRKKGWLKTVKIAGRQYLTQEPIEEFAQRTNRGEFSQVAKVSRRWRAFP
jgi:predicted site-specific integrase-resolvase